MSIQRVTFFFSQFKQGWSETWYIDKSTVELGIIAAQQLGQGLVANRASTVLLDACRTVEVDAFVAPRRSLSKSLNLPGLRVPVGNKLIAGFDAMDVTATSELMECEFNTGPTKALLIRGLLDGDTVRDPVTGAPLPSPGLNAGNNIMQAALLNGPWLQRRVISTTLKVPTLQIREDPTNPDLTQIVCAADPVVDVGDIVKFFKVPLKQVPWLKGTWRVIVDDAPNFSIAYKFPLAAPVSFVGGFVQEVLYQYVTFRGWDLRDFRTRQTGRPTSVTRGRSRGIRFR